MLARAFAVVVGLTLLGVSGCGLILGDADHWFPGPLLRAGAWLVVGVAIGYGVGVQRRHDRRDERRERRDERGA